MASTGMLPCVVGLNGQPQVMAAEDDQDSEKGIGGHHSGELGK